MILVFYVQRSMHNFCQQQKKCKSSGWQNSWKTFDKNLLLFFNKVASTLKGFLKKFKTILVAKFFRNSFNIELVEQKTVIQKSIVVENCCITPFKKNLSNFACKNFWEQKFCVTKIFCVCRNCKTYGLQNLYSILTMPKKTLKNTFLFPDWIKCQCPLYYKKNLAYNIQPNQFNWIYNTWKRNYFHCSGHAAR